MRNTPRLLLVAGILATVILLSFAFLTPHAREVTNAPLLPMIAPPTPVVAVHDTFKKGTHTITGSIVAPNACTVISADAAPITGADASTTESILVAISMPEDSGICLQVPTEMPFSVTLDAVAELPISVTVNGVSASTTAL